MHNVGFTFSNPRRLAFLLLAGLAPMALAEGRFSDPLLGHGLGHSNQGMLGANRHSNQGGDFPGPGPGPTEPSWEGPGQPKFSPTDVLGEDLWVRPETDALRGNGRLTAPVNPAGMSGVDAGTWDGGAQSVPEPSSLLLLGLGIGLLRRR